MKNIYTDNSLLKTENIYRNDSLLRENDLERRKKFKNRIKEYINGKDYKSALEICEQNPYLIKHLSKKQMQILFGKSLEKNIELERENNLLSNKIKREKKLSEVGI